MPLREDTGMQNGLRDRAGPSLLPAAMFFAGATVFGAVVSLIEDVPGEPLTLRIPGSVGVQLAAGLGTAVSAPWPMPIAAVVAALRTRYTVAQRSRACALIGAMLLAGTAIEPATWGRRTDSRLVRAAVAVNVLAAGMLLTAGWSSIQESGPRHRVVGR